MPDINLGQLFAAALGGGVTVKLLDIAYQEILRRVAHVKTTEQFVDQHLDPLLKATDELFGKLRALVGGDFKSVWDIKAFENDEAIQRWVMPLVRTLYRCKISCTTKRRAHRYLINP